MFDIKTMMPDLHIGIKLTSISDGNLLDQYQEKGHSWTRNAYNYLLGLLMRCNGTSETEFGSGYLSSRASSGNIYGASDKTCYRNDDILGYGYYNTTTNGGLVGGIRVGSGNAAFSLEDYNLATLIAHGTGAGQLTRAAMTYPTRNYSDKIWTTTISRDFTNGSGGDVTVREVGLFNQCRIFSASTYDFLFARDVLETPVVVGNAEVLTISYQISKNYSEID